MRLITPYLAFGALLSQSPRLAHACSPGLPSALPTLPEDGAVVGPLPLLINGGLPTLMTEDGTEIALVSVDDEPLSLAVGAAGERLELFRPEVPLAPGPYLVRLGDEVMEEFHIEVVATPPGPAPLAGASATINSGGGGGMDCSNCGDYADLYVEHGVAPELFC